jgi:hypothetical protein
VLSARGVPLGKIPKKPEKMGELGAFLLFDRQK